MIAIYFNYRKPFSLNGCEKLCICEQKRSSFRLNWPIHCCLIYLRTEHRDTFDQDKCWNTEQARN